MINTTCELYQNSSAIYLFMNLQCPKNELTNHTNNILTLKHRN